MNQHNYKKGNLIMNCRSKKTGIFLLFFITVFLMASGAIAATYDLDAHPRDMKPQTQLSSGAATYRFPIETPPGRAGIEPNIALAYNSNGKNGIVGVGWDLPLSYIQRSTRHGLNCDGDEYQVSGSIDLVRRTDWDEEGSTYDVFGAEIEGQFIKYRRYGNRWVARMPDGTRYYYGTSADSRMNSGDFCGGGAVRWYLDKVQDASGNFMTYHYFSDNGQVYLDEIEYTGNGSISPVNSVDFGYDNTREDVITTYPFGSSVKTQRRLSYIIVKGNGLRMRKYVLNYIEPNDPGYMDTGQSLLDTIKIYGKNVDTKLPDESFKYYGVENGFEDNSFHDTITLPATPYLRTGFADLNGDGRTDFWQAKGNADLTYTVTARLAGDNGFLPESAWEKYTFKPFCGLYAGNWGLFGVADFDGDGRADFWYVGKNGKKIKVAISAGSGFGASYPFTDYPAYYYGRANMTTMGFADINGDGVLDHWYMKYYYHHTSSGTYRFYNLYIALSTGNGTELGAPSLASDLLYLGGGSSLETKYGFIDFNNDGKADFYYAHDPFASGKSTLRVQFSEGSGLGSAKGWGETAVAHKGQRHFGDVNGDGKQDYVYIDYANRVRVRLCEEHTAAGFQDNWTDSGPNYLEKTWLLDVNGDGMSDLVYRDNLDKNIKVCLSMGYKFDTAREWRRLDLFEPPDDDGFVDFNGDGKMDSTWLYYKSAAKHIGVAVSDTLPQNALHIIHRSAGSNHEFEYRPSSAYENIELPFGLQLVSSLTSDNGLSGDAYQSYETTFDYEHGVYDKAERDFRGFKDVVKVNPDGSKEVRKYHTDKYNKGKPDYVQLWSSADTKFKETDYNWGEYSLNNSIHTRLESKQTTTIIDNDDFELNEAYEYNYTDKYPRKITTTITGTGLPEPVIKVKWYLHQTADYADWIWRLRGERTTNDPGTNFRKTIYDYYGSGNGYNLYRKTLVNDQGVDAVYEYDYDDYGNLKFEYAVDPVTGLPDTNRYTEYEYEDTTDTFPITTTYYVGGGPEYQESKTYNYRYGKVATETNENGQTTSYEYDGFGRIEQVDQPDGGQTNTIYNDAVMPRTVLTKAKEDSTNTIDTKESYDGLGRKVQTKTFGFYDTGDPVAVYTDYLYDNKGRQNLTEGPYYSGATSYPATRNYYDATDPNRIIKVRTWDGTHGSIDTRYNYEVLSNGIATTIEDADESKKTEIKNCLDQLVQVVEYGDNDQEYTTSYEYNVAGDLTNITDALYNETLIGYDTLGQKISTDDPDMGIWSYTYYADGNLHTQTANGETTTFTYDDRNRIETKVYPDPTVGATNPLKLVRYIYDQGTLGSGQLYQVINYADADETTPYVTTTYDAYDEMGRLIQETKSIADGTGAPPSYTTLYDYDIAGRLSKVAYPGTNYNDYHYKPRTGLLEYIDGIMSYISNGFDDAFIAYHAYDAFGRPMAMSYFNGAAQTNLYDPLSGRLIDCITLNTNIEPYEHLQDKTYTYTPAGDIESITDNNAGVTYNYEYDSLHRLRSEYATGGGAPAMVSNICQYTMDHPLTPAVGEPLHAVNTVTLKTNITNAPYDYSYDSNGNMTTSFDFTNPDNPVTRDPIEYNQEQMPVKISMATGITILLYDGDNVRAKKTAGGTTTYYVNPYYEIDNGVENFYLLADGKRIGFLKDNGVDDPEMRYIHTDHLGSSSVITSERDIPTSSISKLQETTYMPFGLDRTHTGDETDYKFTDQEQDTSSGLYNYNARLYDPAIGMFTMPDTIVPDYTDPQSLNRYAYCLNNPLIYTDPSGHAFVIDDALYLYAAITFVGSVITGIIAHDIMVGTGAADDLAGAILGAADKGLGGEPQTAGQEGQQGQDDNVGPSPPAPQWNSGGDNNGPSQDPDDDSKNEVGDLFKDGRTPKASELKEFAERQGWKSSQTKNGPLKYTDKNGVNRLTIKSGSPRAPGSGNPHVELRNAPGQRVDPAGNPVTRKSPGNHTPIDYDF